MKRFDPDRIALGSAVIVKQFQGNRISGRYLAKMEDGRHVVEMVAMNGTHFVNVFDEEHIFAPPVRRTIFLNIMDGGPAAWFGSEHVAKMAEHTHKVIARAVPIEIEE